VGIQFDAAVASTLIFALVIKYMDVNMWLQRDERHLIEGYWKMLGDITSKKGYEDDNLIPLLASPGNYTKIMEYGKGKQIPDEPEPEPKDNDERNQRNREYLSQRSRVRIANKLLSARGLIDLGNHETVENVVFIHLTPKGYDLGRRYSSKLDRSCLWFEAYRNHWFWLVLSFLGGIIGSLIVNLFSK